MAPCSLRELRINSLSVGGKQLLNIFFWCVGLGGGFSTHPLSGGHQGLQMVKVLFHFPLQGGGRGGGCSHEFKTSDT